MRLSELQDQIDRGDYRVDTQAVADAIVRRLIADHKRAVPEVRQPHSECS